MRLLGCTVVIGCDATSRLLAVVTGLPLFDISYAFHRLHHIRDGLCGVVCVSCRVRAPGFPKYAPVRHASLRDAWEFCVVVHLRAASEQQCFSPARWPVLPLLFCGCRRLPSLAHWRTDRLRTRAHGSGTRLPRTVVPPRRS